MTTINHWQPYGRTLTAVMGYTLNDPRREDGVFIQTTRLVEYNEEEDYFISKSGTHYKLGKALGGRDYNKEEVIQRIIKLKEEQG